MTARELTVAIQDIATDVRELLSRLESMQTADDSPQTSDIKRETLIGALQCAVELARLRHTEIDRRLKLIEQAFASPPAGKDLTQLREELDHRVATLSAELERRLEQIRQEAASRSSDGVRLYWDLKQRLDMLETQQLSRRFSPELQAKFEKHYPEHRWGDTVAAFDRWIMTQKPRHDGPAGAFRKFIAAWLGDSPPRWLSSGTEETPCA